VTISKILRSSFSGRAADEAGSELAAAATVARKLILSMTSASLSGWEK
jgi:hypothetical protein